MIHCNMIPKLGEPNQYFKNNFIHPNLNAIFEFLIKIS